VDLGKQTNSQLHVIHVWDIALSAVLYPDTTDPEGVQMTDPVLVEQIDLPPESASPAPRLLWVKDGACGALFVQVASNHVCFPHWNDNTVE
jgi:hypothetical protein